MPSTSFLLFFFSDTATTEIYTLSLHDALPISPAGAAAAAWRRPSRARRSPRAGRSEEHTSELQSPYDLVCRLLLEKKKKKDSTNPYTHSIMITNSTTRTSHQLTTITSHNSLES